MSIRIMSRVGFMVRSSLGLLLGSLLVLGLVLRIRNLIRPKLMISIKTSF